MTEGPHTQDLRSSSLRELHMAVAREYFPHELKGLGASRGPGMVKTIDLGELTLGKIRWGADVSLDCEYPGEAYEINVVLEGELAWEREGKRFSAEAGQAAVFVPGRRSAITRWSADALVLGIKLNRQVLQREFSRLGYSSVGAETVVVPKLDLRTAEGSSWLNYIQFTAGQLVADPVATSIPEFRESVVGAVSAPMMNFLLPEGVRAVSGPFMIRRVQEDVEADLARKWTLDEMSVVAGVGRRRLQQAFKDYLGKSPTAWLLQVRLEAAYRLLTSRTPDTAISDIAHDVGFNHLGRFAQEFREMYGHLPSETPVRFEPGEGLTPRRPSGRAGNPSAR